MPAVARRRLRRSTPGQRHVGRPGRPGRDRRDEGMGRPRGPTAVQRRVLAGPRSGDGTRGAAYQQAVKDYVDLLVASYINVILDLHWTFGQYRSRPGPTPTRSATPPGPGTPGAYATASATSSSSTGPAPRPPRSAQASGPTCSCSSLNIVRCHLRDHSIRPVFDSLPSSRYSSAIARSRCDCESGRSSWAARNAARSVELRM